MMLETLSTITLMKGNAGTPTRFWDYIVILPSEAPHFLEAGYVLCLNPRFGLRKSVKLKMKLLEINKRERDEYAGYY